LLVSIETTPYAEMHTRLIDARSSVQNYNVSIKRCAV